MRNLYKIVYDNGVTQGIELYVACYDMVEVVNYFNEFIYNSKNPDAKKLVKVELVGNCKVL